MSTPPDRTPDGPELSSSGVGAGTASDVANRTPAPAVALPPGQSPRLTRLAPIKIRTRGRVSIDERREDVREFLARRLVSVLVLTLLLGSALMASRKFTGVSAEDTRLYFQVAFTAVLSRQRGHGLLLRQQRRSRRSLAWRRWRSSIPSPARRRVRGSVMSRGGARLRRCGVLPRVGRQVHRRPSRRPRPGRAAGESTSPARPRARPRAVLMDSGPRTRRGEPGRRARSAHM